MALSVSQVAGVEDPGLDSEAEADVSIYASVCRCSESSISNDNLLYALQNNHGLSAPLKNALDWGSRPPNVWADKAAAIVSASGGSGGSRSQYHLRQIGVFLDLHFINKPELLLDAFHNPGKFDKNGDLIDAETKERLKQVLLSLQTFTLRLQGRSKLKN
ncbi:PREDICTED: NADPH:quinone oxidoreductase-like [Fragaria vesca subsp. vesca]